MLTRKAQENQNRGQHCTLILGHVLEVKNTTAGLG